MAVPPVSNDDFGTRHGRFATGRGGRDRHLKFYELRDILIASLAVAGFRYVLELVDGESADPAMFNTALPPGMWRPGDTFIAASDLRQFRILGVAVLAGRGREHADACWIVGPVH